MQIRTISAGNHSQCVYLLCTSISTWDETFKAFPSVWELPNTGVCREQQGMRLPLGIRTCLHSSKGAPSFREQYQTPKYYSPTCNWWFVTRTCVFFLLYIRTCMQNCILISTPLNHWFMYKLRSAFILSSNQWSVTVHGCSVSMRTQAKLCQGRTTQD